MSFGAPLALLALLALPAIAFLHMFRRRLPPRRVAGLFLFAPDAMVASSGRRRSRLLRSASLWLELLAAVALALWLAQPRLDAGAPPPHLVVVLDDSASMSARAADGATFAERARETVRAAHRALGDDAQTTLVLTGVRPRVVVGPRGGAPALRDALADWRPTAPQHPFDSALELALELAAADGELLFVSDRLPSVLPPGVRCVAVGEPCDNAAIVHARRVPREDGEQLFFDVVALARTPLARTLRLASAAAPDRALIERPLRLEPDAVTRVELPLPPGTGAVAVSFAEDDALALDDRCLLLPEPRRVVTVHVGLPDELAAALELDAALQALPAVRVGAAAETAALRITTAAAPMLAAVAELVIEPGAEPFATWAGPFLQEHRHPLLHGLAFGGVLWTAGVAEPRGQVLVSTGEHPLAMLEEDVDDRQRLHLVLDPRRSNLPTSPDWPILLLNLVEAARARLPGPLQINGRVGAELRYRVPPGNVGTGEVWLVGDDGGRVPARGQRELTAVPLRAGLHHLRRGEEELATFSVAFADAHESDLRHRESGEQFEPLPPRPQQEGAADDGGDTLRRILALLLLAAVTLDWWVLRGGASAVVAGGAA